MKYKLYKATTSKLIPIFIQDTTSVTGKGLIGLTYTSSGLSWYYLREGAAAPVAVTLADLVVGTWASGGFKEIDATNMPGFYQVGVPNAAIAAGANSVSMVLRGATNMVPRPLEIELDAINYQDAVRAGLTALPNAADNAVGGLTTNITAAKTLTVAYDAAKTAASPANVSTALSTYGTATGTEVGNVALSVWNILASVVFTTGSLGEKLKNWVVGKVLSYDTGMSPGEQVTGFATPTNVTDAQGVITDAIADMPVADISGALTAYGVSTATELGTTQTAIINALPDVSSILTSYDAAKTSDITTALDTITDQLDILEGLIDGTGSGTVATDIAHIKTVIDNLRGARRAVIFQ